MLDPHATRVVRLYADDFGESRFETVTLPMSQKDFAPPAAPLYAAQLQPAQHYVIIELPVGWGGTESHPTPGRHMLFCLAGLQRDGKFRGNAVVRGWRLSADGGYNGQRSNHRGDIGRTGQGGDDPARIAWLT
jgi:hypothetical protein